MIALIALMFMGQLVIISYMRAHNNCNNDAAADGGGQPLSLVRSDGRFADDTASNGYFGGADDENNGEDDDPDGLMAGLDDDDYEPIVGEDGVWGDQDDDDGIDAADMAEKKTPKGYEEDLLPRIKKPMIVGTCRGGVLRTHACSHYLTTRQNIFADCFVYVTALLQRLYLYDAHGLDDGLQPRARADGARGPQLRQRMGE